MQPIQIINKTIITVIFLISFPLTVFAQQDRTDRVDFGDDIGFKWFEVLPQLDLANFGVLNVAGFIVMFIVAWMIIYTIWLAIKVAWTAIRSRGESDAIQEGAETGRELIKGIAVSFLWMAIYIAISLWLGVGNLFKWPEMLTQCGDGTAFFQAEYNADQVLRENGYTFNTEKSFTTLGYCCKLPPEGVNFDETVLKDDGVSPYAQFNPNEDHIQIIVNQDQNGGGWYFDNQSEMSVSDNANNITNCNLIFD